MLREPAGVLARLLVPALVAGCIASPQDGPGDLGPDGFETDDTRELAKEQPVNGPPQPRTLWPAGDVDFVRFRVDEVDPDGEDENGPHYFVTVQNASPAVAADLWNDQGVIDLSVDPHYRVADGGFTEPGIYYIKAYDDGVTGGEYQTWIPFQRDGDTRDLVAPCMSVPMEATSGEEAAFGVWVVNQGGLTTGTFHAALFLSADDELDAGDRQIGEEEVGYELPKGFSCGVSFAFESFSPDPPTLVGPVYLIAVIDSRSEVSETGYEQNNTIVGSTLVDPAAYDATLPPDPDPLVPTAGSPTVALRGLLLYPADDRDTTDIDESDADEFELQLDAGLRYYEIWTENLVGWADTKLEIVDSGGEALDPAVEAEDGGLENGASYLLVDRQELDSAGSGPWYVRVTDEQGNSGGYDLVVRAADAPPDAFEPDGNSGTWRVLRADSPDALRSFSTADDEDWCAYPVSVSNGGRSHTIETHSLSGCDTVLYLHDSKGEALPYSDDDSGAEAGASRIGPLGLSAGLYYVRATNKNGQPGGTYKLRSVVTDF